MTADWLIGPAYDVLAAHQRRVNAHHRVCTG